MIGNGEIWRGCRVLVTGHTGFKGSWACRCLERLGAQVSGISLAPETTPSLFNLLQPWDSLDSRIVDIRDLTALKAAVDNIRPEIVIHMAAQALVRCSYREPLDTMTTNVIGTANLLDVLRGHDGLKAVLVITSDKVYRNSDTGTTFREDFPLGGDDPYSASKAATEMVTWSWARSFFDKLGVPVATARAGNVLGGGDFSEDRLVPDVWRAVKAGDCLTLRYPGATRPWQHVLDLTAGYIAYVERLLDTDKGPAPTSLNFGPNPKEQLTVQEISTVMLDALGASGRLTIGEATVAEKMALSIDPSHAMAALDWSPKLNMIPTLDWTAEWYRRFDEGASPMEITLDQIQRYNDIC